MLLTLIIAGLILWLKKKVIFSEITPTPESGQLKFSPAEWDLLLGCLWGMPVARGDYLAGIKNVRCWHEADRLKHCKVCYEREVEVSANCDLAQQSRLCGL